MPKFHPPVELLMQSAAGTACEAVDLLVACHTSLCPECSQTFADLESAGALLAFGAADAVVDELADGADNDDSLGELLGQLGEQDSLPLDDAAQDPLLPEPLLHYVGPSDRLAWKRAIPGVFSVELPLRWGDFPVRLVRTSPGRGIPEHTHAGYECDLILQGGLEDLTRGGDFERGDVQSADEDVTHHLRVLDGEDCVLVAFHEGRSLGSSVGAKLLYKMLGW